MGNPTITADAAGIDIKDKLSGVAPSKDITATTLNGIITLGGADAGDISTLPQWVEVARAMTTVDGAVSAFKLGSDTYVFQENTGGDLLIKLTGISTADALATSGTGANDILIG